MRTELVRKRYKDVLRMDSITTTQGDFLGTHVPFSKMTVERGQGTARTVQTISEDTAFQTYFDDPTMLDQHQLMIVEGSSGAGKSHFIRWLHAKLINREDSDEVILLIRRSDNTLKGTIRQLLAIDEVKNLRNKELYERLVKANQTISEQKLKIEIFHRFLAEVQSDEDAEELNTSRRKGLYALLKDSSFEELMLTAGGPIDRIYSKVTAIGGKTNQDIVALFVPEDFILSIDFVEDMRVAGADRKAIRMADLLISNGEDDDGLPRKVADYLNSHVEDVIQSCAGIEPGDFQQIFKEIRQELKRQGKRLTLLIEDITSFTGINQALLNALVTEHTGLNQSDELCRLVSVVGTTTEYYKQFRDNYKDRITAQITIQDEAFGEKELMLFVAKYLNIMSLEPEVIEEWMKNGAREEEYPSHQPTEGMPWGNVIYQGKQLNLYPFTQTAIRNLYNRMSAARTPRYILRDIIEPAVNDILYRHDGFPAFCKNISIRLSEQVNNRIHSIVEQFPLSDTERAEYSDRLLRLVAIWGDGTLNSGAGTLSGLPLELYQELGLQMFSNAIYNGQGESSPTGETEKLVIETSAESSMQVIVPPSPGQKRYEEFFGITEKWRYQQGVLTKYELVRDGIIDFVMSTINWQQEKVSIRTVDMVQNSKKKLIGFEQQNRGLKDALIIFPVSDESYQLLLAFGKWLYLGNKSWNFEGAELALYMATTWLIKYKDEFVRKIQGIKVDQIPLYQKCAMIAELYRKILNGEYPYRTLDKLDHFLFSKEMSPQATISGHSEKWKRVLEGIYSNKTKAEDVHNLTSQYFNIVQGNRVTASTYILNYTAFQNTMRQIKSSKMVLTEEERKQRDDITSKDEMTEYLIRLLPKLDDAVNGEKEAAKQIYIKLLQFFEFDEDDEIEVADVRDMLTNIRDFYRDVDQYGMSISCPHDKIDRLLRQSTLLTQEIKRLGQDYSGWNTLEVLLEFAGDPLKIVQPFFELLKNADEDSRKVLAEKRQEREKLIQQGGWTDQSDPRFADYQKEFEMLRIKYAEVTI